MQRHFWMAITIALLLIVALPALPPVAQTSPAVAKGRCGVAAGR